MIVVEYGICHGSKIVMISSCYRFSRNLQWMEIWPNEILKATEGTPVMTQCEREGLYKKGAGVQFYYHRKQHTSI